MIEIVNESPIQFKTDGQQLVKTLKKMSGIIKAATVLFAANQGKLVAILYNDDRYMQHEIEAQVKGNGCFTVSLNHALGTFNSRSKLSFKQDRKLQFKAETGAYSGSLEIQDVAPELIKNLNRVFAQQVESFSLPKRTLNQLYTGIKHCSITDPYAQSDQQLVRYIIGEEDSLRVVSFDNYHSALWQAQVKDKFQDPFILAIYPAYFSYIQNLAKTDSVSISITDKMFAVHSANFNLFLPPVQVDKKDFKASLTALDKLVAEAKLHKSVLSSLPLRNTVENFYSLYEKGSAMTVKASPERLEFSLASDHGVLTDSIELSRGKGSGEILVNVFLLKEVLSLAPEQDLKFAFTSKFFSLDYTDKELNLVYLIALMQK